MFQFYQRVWSEFFKEPVDEMPSTESSIREAMKRVVLFGEWYEVYDFLEFSIRDPSNGNRDRLSAETNRILQEEWAGFKLVKREFWEIGTQEEIIAVESALALPERFAPVRSHLEQALSLLSDRRNPDYRNSIKESISAVEAVTQILSGESDAELGKALTMIDRKTPIHGALKTALRALYGYTSDADGIRHALSEASSLDGADAKFMLVVCSGFVSFLTQKAT